MSARVRMAMALAGFLWTVACADDVDQDRVAPDARNDTAAATPATISAHATDSSEHGQHSSGQVGQAVDNKVEQPTGHDAHAVVVNGTTDAPQNGHAAHAAVNPERTSAHATHGRQAERKLDAAGSGATFNEAPSPTSPSSSNGEVTTAKLHSLAGTLSRDPVVQQLIARDSTLRRLWQDTALRARLLKAAAQD